MKSLLVLGLLGCLVLGSATQPVLADTVYEMRTYTAHEGKLDNLLARFREHTCKLFEKHGMTNVGYFVPTTDNNNQLIYFLSYPSRDARDVSWAAFLNDADWKAVYQKSRSDGPLVKAVDSKFMVTTDYSPEISPSIAELRRRHREKLFEAKVQRLKERGLMRQLAQMGKTGQLPPGQTIEDVQEAIDQIGGPSNQANRLFELRMYTATSGNLANLDARFRDHTIKLFEKHGITNVAYFHLMPDQEGAENHLIYLIAHDDLLTRDESFKNFAQDPAWKKARLDSEENAGGSLTEKGGVKNLFLEPTDFSPLK